MPEMLVLPTGVSPKDHLPGVFRNLNLILVGRGMAFVSGDGYIDVTSHETTLTGVDVLCYALVISMMYKEGSHPWLQVS
jgi:hypothetical protein